MRQLCVSMSPTDGITECIEHNCVPGFVLAGGLLRYELLLIWRRCSSSSTRSCAGNMSTGPALTLPRQQAGRLTVTLDGATAEERLTYAW